MIAAWLLIKSRVLGGKSTKASSSMTCANSRVWRRVLFSRRSLAVAKAPSSFLHFTNHALECVRRAVAVGRARVLCEQFNALTKWVIARNQNTPSAIATMAIAATAVRAARISASGLISCLSASEKYQAAARIP
jgi:hypothetical protein